MTIEQFSAERISAPDFSTRIRVLRAMDTLARAINDEEIFDYWLMFGVADGDITTDTKDEDLLLYVHEDEDFAQIMRAFLLVMSLAKRNGGLYVDEVVSAEFDD